MPPAKNGLKVCSKCKIERPVSEFSKCKREKDGLQYHCKYCQNPRKTARRTHQFRSINGEKKCSKCFKILSTENFYKNHQCFDGLHPWCKECYKIYVRNRPSEGRSCRKILLKHHEDLKHDPERLSTKFIADVVGCRCRRLEEKE
jgi:hypothetical protein